MKRTKINKNFSTEESIENVSVADKELHELAERLEKELGHQYFDQPLNLASLKKEEKKQELIELEQEIEKLGKIVLPQADLKPSEELTAGGTEVKKDKKQTLFSQPKYENFKLYRPGKKKKIKKEKTLEKYQSFQLYWPEKEKFLAVKTDKKQLPSVVKKYQSFKLYKKNKTPKEDLLPLEKHHELVKEKNKKNYQSFHLFREQSWQDNFKKNNQHNLASIEEHQENLQKQLLAQENRQKEEALREEKREERKKDFENWRQEKEDKRFMERQRRAERIKLRQERQNKRQKEKRVWPKIGWYITIVKKPVLYLCLAEFVVYFLSSITFLKDIMLSIVLPGLILADVAVFIWLVKEVKKNYGQNYWVAVQAVFWAGILTGLGRAIFKIIWINEAWTIVNILVEPLLWGGYGLLTGLIFGVLIKKK